jgi:kinesin family protein 12
MNSVERVRGDAHLFRFPPPPAPSLDQPPLHRELQVVSASAPNSQRELVRSFQFDLCASEQLSQTQFFRFSGVAGLLDAVTEGYLATVFAYGQTGSGKTYSMSGTDELLSEPAGGKSGASANGSGNAAGSDESDGVIPRALRYLYDSFRRAPNGTSFVVRASYCEIYNEHVYDLLNSSSGSLHVRFSDRSGFYVQNLLVVQCDSLDDVLAVVREGHRNRRVGSHEMNKDSSRSHSLLTVHVDRVTKDDSNQTTATKYGKVSFVDLAGSERLKETRSSNAEETSNINKSLLTLGKVISALSSSSSAPSSSTTSNLQSNAFIPYRDSKLTMLLMDSLGGNSLTLMIACVSPSVAALDDSLSTLNYATRAKNIQNRPAVQVDPVEFALSNLRKENQSLRAENEALRHRLRAVEISVGSNMTLSSSNTSSRHLLPPLSARNEPENRSPTSKYGRQDAAKHSPTQNSPSKVSSDAHRNQLAALQNENDTLTQRATFADQQLQRLKAENEMLRHQQAQQGAQMVNSTATTGGPGAAPELDRLKQQVQQLQQREQELMQALVRDRYSVLVLGRRLTLYALRRWLIC